MKITSVVVLLFLAFVTLCHCDEKATDFNQKGLQVEDAETAESQDVVYRSQPLLDGTTYTDEDRPRRRYRGNGKRRRRQRKRIRSTTPSLIEDQTSHPIELLTEQDDRSAERGEVVYERRRQGKRRRRPLRRPQPFETYRHELPDKEENPIARSSPRRRRKGQRRKRIRIKSNINHEDGNYTDENKTNVEQTTLQTEQEILMNTYPPMMTESEQKNVENIHETMATIMPGSVFTPSEISEINYNLEPVSSKHSFDDEAYTLSEQPTNPEQDMNESFLYTKIPVKFNIGENSSVVTTTLKNTQNPTTDVTTPKFIYQETVEPFKDEFLKIQPNLNVGNNIEAIIKSRKSLFSISRRLPPTSAVIRRRLRPRLQKNSTDIETNSKINSPTHLNTEKKVCKDGNCIKELLPVIKNDVPMIPHNLLPAGFMTLPEIISPKQLISKLQFKTTSELVSSKTEQSPTTINNNATIPTTYATPTTEVTPTHSTTAESSTTSSTATTETSTIFSSTKESTTHKELSTKNTENLTEERTKVESLRLGADLPNLNDSILDLLITENGKSRLSRILKLRNMTLQELLDHRERGSSQRHLSDIFTNNKEKIQNETDNLEKDKIEIQFLNDSDHNHNNSYLINLISDDLDSTIPMNSQAKFDESIKLMNKDNYNNTESERSMSNKIQPHDKSKSLKSIFEDDAKLIKVEGTVIPVPILEPTHISMIQFPDDNILGAFPKFLTDTLKSNRDIQRPIFEELNGSHETINKPEINLSNEGKKEPTIFDSMPNFNTKLKPYDQNNLKPNHDQHNLRLNPDYRMLTNKGSEPNFPRIGDELFFHTSSPRSTIGDIVDDIVLLQENDDSHQRNHILGGHISAESAETFDEDYTDYRKLPTGVKSAIFASIAIFGLAILGFLSVLVSCRIRQRKARLRKRNDILCAHLHDDLRSSQNSLTPVLKKGHGNCSGHQFSQGIHSNTSSNRHYYLWRTLRKTFQYE